MYIIHDGKEVPLVRSLPVPIVHTEKLEHGWYRARNRYIRGNVVHWGGVTRRSIYRTLVNNNLSTHFAVDVDAIYQWLDTAKVAQHCGPHNWCTLGIDICQWPIVSSLHHYPPPEWDVKVVPFRSNRTSQREVLTLDSRLVRNTRALLIELSDTFHLPLEVPPEDCIVEEPIRGTMGHHHLTMNKWDILPWWGQIFDGWKMYKTIEV